MRYFFTEKHKTPLAWFTMRLQYARSAATSSMIGHAVGLGDRHCSNILIHEKTGELIHIDHGVAFDAVRPCLRACAVHPLRPRADSLMLPSSFARAAACAFPSSFPSG
jgi:ataxia telangiectasia mutated family protein